jgi:hypothetical protein
MNSQWQVVYSFQVYGTQMEKLLLRVTKLEGDGKVLIMDLREIIDGRFSKHGVALNQRETKYLVDALATTRKHLPPPVKANNSLRTFSLKRSPNGLDLILTKADGNKQSLFVLHGNATALRDAVYEGLVYMDEEANNMGLEPMDCN